MAQAYRLEVSSPTTATNAAKAWSFDATSGNVIHIDVELKREKHRISVLTCRIHDLKWDIFNALPDPAFSNVPVKLYLAPPGNPRSPTVLVFDGKVTSLQAGYPAVSTLTIVAHDKSIDMRKKAVYRTLRNKTSVQLAQEIAKEYGYTVDVDAGSVTVRTTAVEMGAELSDWDHIGRALAADGLYCHMDGSTLRIRQLATKAYPSTFSRDVPPVINLNAQINHVSGPGEGGDTKTPIALENSGTAQAVSSTKAEADKEAASRRTHRRPVQGADASVEGAHSEDLGSSPWSNKVTGYRHRKDSATLVLTSTPDLTMLHTVPLAGWGAKVDGTWYPSTIKHTITGAEASLTTVSMERAPSASAAKSAGVAFSK